MYKVLLFKVMRHSYKGIFLIGFSYSATGQQFAIMTYCVEEFLLFKQRLF